MQYDWSYFDAGDPRPGYFTSYSWAEYGAEAVQLAAALWNLFAPRRMLDLGCAKGFLLQAFDKPGSRAFGIDISAYALGCAAPAVRPRTAMVDLGGAGLPFKDGAFDLVTCFGVIELLDNHDALIDEAIRVLEPGGVLALKTIARTASPDDLCRNAHRAEWWVDYFRRRGFTVLESQSARLREAMFRGWLEVALRSGRSRKARVAGAICRLAGGLGEAIVFRAFRARMRGAAGTTPVLVVRTPADR